MTTILESICEPPTDHLIVGYILLFILFILALCIFGSGTTILWTRYKRKSSGSLVRKLTLLLIAFVITLIAFWGFAMYDKHRPPICRDTSGSISPWPNFDSKSTYNR